MQVETGATHIVLRNDSLRDIEGTLIVESHGPSGTIARSVRAVALRPGQLALLDTEHRMAELGTYRIMARFEDAAGPLWAPPAVRIDVPPEPAAEPPG